MKKNIFIAFILFGCFAVQSYATPPLRYRPGEKLHHDDVHKIPDINQLRRQGMGREAIARVIGATGTKKVAVLLVSFSSSDSSTSGFPAISAADMSQIQDTVDFLKNFYYEASYHQLTLNVDYIVKGGATSSLSAGSTAFMLPYSMQTYGSDSPDIDANSEALFADALTAAQNAGITITRSAVDNSNYNILFVVHAGYGEEASQSTGDIWSQFRAFNSTYNGFSEGLTVPAKPYPGSSPRGVFCHEFGHQLGLPDLYDTVTAADRVGRWDLMDYGVWDGPVDDQGGAPSLPSAWCRYKLGWLLPSVQTQSGNLTIRNAENYNDVIKFPILGSSKEYFLLEYRHKIDEDAYLPGEGALIWHIDETVMEQLVGGQTRLELNTVNTDANHLAVGLEEADKGDDVSTNLGDSTDPFSNINAIFTAPQSSSFSGGMSGITITNFLGTGTRSMTAIATQISISQDLILSEAYSYPNPSRAGSPAKIHFTLSRPASSGTVRIYTVSGELILSHDITLSDWNVSDSEQKGQWVYEYSWPLTNASGANVSSGLYFFVLQVNIEDSGGTVTSTQVKTGKIAVIR